MMVFYRTAEQDRLYMDAMNARNDEIRERLKAGEDPLKVLAPELGKEEEDNELD